MELSGQLHISGRFIPWKEPRYSLNRGLAEPQSRYGLYGKEEVFLSRPDFEPSWHNHCNYYALWAAILKYFLQVSMYCYKGCVADRNAHTTKEIIDIKI